MLRRNRPGTKAQVSRRRRRRCPRGRRAGGHAQCRRRGPAAGGAGRCRGPRRAYRGWGGRPRCVRDRFVPRPRGSGPGAAAPPSPRARRKGRGGAAPGRGERRGFQARERRRSRPGWPRRGRPAAGPGRAGHLWQAGGSAGGRGQGGSRAGRHGCVTAVQTPRARPGSGLVTLHMAPAGARHRQSQRTCLPAQPRGNPSFPYITAHRKMLVSQRCP